MVIKPEGEQLCLFGCGGVDLVKLRSAREGLGGAAHASGTSKGYSCDWRIFSQWCAAAGREYLPGSSDTVALYATWLLVDQERKVNTASRHVASIAHFHKAAGLPSPVNSEVRSVITAVRRRRQERPQGKSALDPAALLKAVRACDPSTNSGARDRAILVLGFATSLRRSNLCALQLSDLAFERRGLAVFVRRSKTDQMGRGRLVGVWPVMPSSA
jgi:integrase